MRTRSTSLAALLTVGGLSIAVAGYQTPARPPIGTIQKVKDNLFFISGGDPSKRETFAGGNTGVFVTGQGVVLIDSMNPGYGRAILEQVRSVTDKPVTMLINTHTHTDHTGSNTELPATIEFVAHENTRANLSRTTCPPVTNCGAFKGDNAKYLPKRTFKDRLSLFSGRDQIDLYYFGPAHTNGDAWIVFPAARTMLTDIFGRKHPPFIDVANGGSAVGFSEALDKAVAGIQNVDTIITSHASSLQTWADLKEFADYYREILTAAQQGVTAGKTVDEAAAAYRPGGRFKSYGADPPRVKSIIEAAYAELRK